MHHKFFQLTNKSFEELGVSNYKELWDKVQEKGFTAIQTSIKTVFTKSDSNDDIFHVVLSDAIEDRHGDIVKQEWVLKNFKKNPVLLDSHNYSSIEKILGRFNTIEVKDEKLQGDIEFALMNPLGVLARDMAKDGFLNALSAGFIPLAFGEAGEITKSELLEGSMVSVPANPRTLIDKKKGIEEPVVPPTPEPEPTADPVVPETKTVVAKKSTVQLLQEELSKRDGILKSVASELKKSGPENLAETKRRIWKELRKAL